MTKQVEESFKREVAHFAVASGLSRRQVAVDFGVGLSSVNRWVDQFGDGGSVASQATDLAAENKRLRKELQIAQQERDILNLEGSENSLGNCFPRTRQRCTSRRVRA